MSIAPPTGHVGLSRPLVSSQTYRSIRERPSSSPSGTQILLRQARLTEEYSRGFWTGGTLFESWASSMSAGRRP